MKYESLDHELGSTGYLSLSKAVKWLKEQHPEVAVSYPTAMRMVHGGQIEAMRIGSIWRLTRAELTRYVFHGNREVNAADAEQTSLSEDDETTTKKAPGL